MVGHRSIAKEGDQARVRNALVLDVGEVRLNAEAVQRFGAVGYNTARNRITKLGWEPIAAVTTAAIRNLGRV